MLTLRRGVSKSQVISLSFNDGVAEDPVWSRETLRGDVVQPEDPDAVVRLPPDPWVRNLSRSMSELPSSLHRLGLDVSTGPVVGFRLSQHFASPNGADRVPFLHPVNFRNLGVRWPVSGNKPQALVLSDEIRNVLIPSGWYVVTKRFTTKEEPRRVVASVIDPSFSDAGFLGLENHLNYFHQGGKPLERAAALGLATFLNSTWIDCYFRQFSGHTQVNANDLRNLKYPEMASLARLGAALDEPLVGPEADHALRTCCDEVQEMPESNHVQDRIDEAVTILGLLGLPRGQRNERSALALLALLALRRADSWAAAATPLIGVTPIMEWAAEHYGRGYAANTRETFRRFTLHQFVDAGLVVPNPDQPNRPVNSPKYCYQVEPEAYALLKTFGGPEWASSLARYRVGHEALKARYRQLRRMAKIPLILEDGVEIALTPGGQNELVQLVVSEFCPRFVPGGEVVHVGDAGKKWAFFNQQLATELSIVVDEHGKMPDVIVYDRKRNWLVLVEAVTSHGPVDFKRRGELQAAFATVTPGLVLVTAFHDRRTFLRHASEIAWRTEVWLADSPGHLLHFDGERFLGPYDEETAGP